MLGSTTIRADRSLIQSLRCRKSYYLYPPKFWFRQKFSKFDDRFLRWGVRGWGMAKTIMAIYRDLSA
jgi:hypothetical protein